MVIGGRRHGIPRVGCLSVGARGRLVGKVMGARFLQSQGASGCCHAQKSDFGGIWVMVVWLVPGSSRVRALEATVMPRTVQSLN